MAFPTEESFLKFGLVPLAAHEGGSIIPAMERHNPGQVVGGLNSGTAQVLWITGLPGAGKTTTAEILLESLRDRGIAAVHVDGDSVRELMGGDLGYTRPERLENARRIARLCALIAGQGFPVVCSTVSLFREIHDWNRSNLPGYFEVLLRIRPDTYAKRDKKGMVSGAMTGAADCVPGLQQEVEFPAAPDLVIDADDEHPPSTVAARILSTLDMA